MSRHADTHITIVNRDFKIMLCAQFSQTWFLKFTYNGDILHYEEFNEYFFGAKLTEFYKKFDNTSHREFINEHVFFGVL